MLCHGACQNVNNSAELLMGVLLWEQAYQVPLRDIFVNFS